MMFQGGPVSIVSQRWTSVEAIHVNMGENAETSAEHMSAAVLKEPQVREKLGEEKQSYIYNYVL